MPNRSLSAVSSHHTAAGTLLGLFSALAYTATNVLLRYLAADHDARWISCLKAAPTVVIAAILIGPAMARGRQIWPSASMLFVLVGTGLVVQLGGNLAFQFALSTIGLALTVPLCFATLLFAGAIMGRAWLGEALSLRAVAAMGLCVAAIGLLAWHAEHANMLNASQVALAAVAGVLVFDEPADAALGVGIALMLVGLLMYRAEPPPTERIQPPFADH